jgi:hypothetical protein
VTSFIVAHCGGWFEGNPDNELAGECGDEGVSNRSLDGKDTGVSWKPLEPTSCRAPKSHTPLARVLQDSGHRDCYSRLQSFWRKRSFRYWVVIDKDEQPGRATVDF